MQLIKSKTSLSVLIILVLSLITLAISVKLEKSSTHTNSLSMETSERTELTLTKRSTKSQSKTNSKNKNKMKSKSTSKGAPYSTTTAIQLFKDLGQHILTQSANTAQTLGGCLAFMVDKPKDYETVLNSFWDAMGNIVSKQQKVDPKNFQNVLDTLSAKTILIGDQSVTCGSLKLNASFDESKILSILNQDSYLGGFNNDDGKTKQEFIDGMISTHRDAIDANTFLNLNKVSRGEGTDSKLAPSTTSAASPAPSTGATPSPASSSTPAIPVPLVSAPGATSATPSSTQTPAGATPSTAPAAATPAPATDKAADVPAPAAATAGEDKPADSKTTVPAAKTVAKTKK